MAVNRIRIDATPAQTFDVLADAGTYADWVVGTKRVRGVDDGWPAAGTCLHHTVGIGPITLDDSTEVLEVARPARLVLEARGRPLGAARVELHLEADGDGTKVTMVEELMSSSRAARRLADGLVWLRNCESLRRLRRLAQQAQRPQPAG